MAKEMETPKDEGLQGNETIEEAILGLQKEPTPELLAHVLPAPFNSSSKLVNAAHQTFPSALFTVPIRI